jgi:uncharacterized protein (DUF362 family)
MNKKELKNNVSVVKTAYTYPDFPYAQKNSLRTALENLFEGLGLSKDNPFGTYVSSGQTVLLKPNWVRHKNPLGHSIDSLITHPSLIKYILDFVGVALKGKGKIIIADAPLQNCDFDTLKKEINISAIIKNFNTVYPDIEVIVEDWRITTIKNSNAYHKDIQNVRLTDRADVEKEYVVVDQGRQSFLEDISQYAHRFRVTKYKPSVLQSHHTKGVHEYLIARRVFEADFIINIPKLKTHIKAGITCAMKNLVGINGHKEFLPHHIKGSYFEGGDNYATPSWFKRKYEDLYDHVWEHINTFSVIKRKILMKTLDYLWACSKFFGAENISAGSWMGNDTIWRTTLDLNHIAYFNDSASGNVFTIVDGIVSGEGEGPLEPTPRPLGILVAGENPAYIDAVVAHMVGYVVARIPTVYQAIYNRKSKFGSDYLEDFKVSFYEGERKAVLFDDIPRYNLKKPLFWKGAAV